MGIHSDRSLLEATGVSKSFPGVQALSKVDFELRAGEVHAIVGENGAGKSTLVKILTGIEFPDEGVITLGDEPVRFKNATDAERSGISAIQQEITLVPELDIAHNLLLGSIPTKGRRLPRGLSLIDRDELYKRASEALALLGVEIDPRSRAGALGASQAQLVLIARGLSRDMRVLLMDEPTAALTPKERDELFAHVEGLKSRGVGIVYVSHRLDEVMQLADRITVFRDGHKVATMLTGESSLEQVIELMLARSLEEMYPKEEAEIGMPVLEIRGASRGRLLRNVSLTVRAGEIVGVTGLVGAGKTELVRVVFGADRLDSGEILLDGRPLTIRSPAEAIRAGIALVPEDRKSQGLVLPLPVRTNIALPIANSKRVRRSVVRRFGFVSRNRLDRVVKRFIDIFRIRLRSPLQPVNDLSGGNQQKVVLAKWLATRPKVMILDEPTRGVDVGSKVEIYQAMERLAREGVGILMVSSEAKEVVAMSDRVLVMRKGAIVAELGRSEASDPLIMRHASAGVIE